MPQNITFDTSSGIDLTGWWCNPRTGESYKVVDQFFQDNVLYVKTDKGQMLNYNVIQNLVKSDGPLKGPVTPQNPQPANNINDILLDGLVEEDIDILTQPVNRTANREQKPKPESVNKMIIEKAFSKADSAPAISLGIHWNWPGLPQALAMLKETMDIPVPEIVDYLYDKYSEQMSESIKTVLAEYVERGGAIACP